MTALRLSWRSLQLVLHILLGLILTPLLSKRNPHTGAHRTQPSVVAWWHGRLLNILHVKFSVSGHIPQGPAMLVSNHISWLDIIVLGHLAQTVFLSKDEVRKWPIIGYLATTAGTLYIKRGGGQASQLNQTLNGQLSQGGLVTLFPEGTTTDGTLVLPFFPRLMAAAIDSGTPVIPTSLRYHINGEIDLVAPYIDDQSLGENMLGLLKRKQNQVDVQFLTPIATTGLDRKELASQARDAIVESLSLPQLP